MNEALIAFILAIVVLFIIFKIFNWSLKIFFRLLINALIGGVMLFVFNFVFAGLLDLSAFAIDINWVSSLVTGIFGVPGVLVLLIVGLL